MAAPTTSRSLPAFLRQSRGEVHAKFVDLEWQQRNRLLQGTQQPADPAAPPSPFSRMSTEFTATRNRYMNVEPFAPNRVKLRVLDGHNDYINASPIQLGKRRYIATQGPKDVNVNHFYRMVESEIKSPAVVIMLTQTHEAGKEKCFQYYPLSEEESPMIVPDDKTLPDEFQGEIELQSIEEDEKTRSEIRTMILRTSAREGRQAQEKVIHHLLFSGWPDFLIPEGDDRAALVELVRLSAVLNRQSPHEPQTHTNGNATVASDFTSYDQENPRIVHCSAGVGRSGTFIALDYLFFLLYSGELDNITGDEDPIMDTIDLLRQQRMMMVQGESQFAFLYDVLREAMTARMNEKA